MRAGDGDRRGASASRSLEPVPTWPAAVLTTAEEASGQPLPADLITPLSTTTIAAPPAPTVTAVSPSSGSTAGGTSITITGTGFVSGATVKVGGAAATGVTVEQRHVDHGQDTGG